MPRDCASRRAAATALEALGAAGILPPQAVRELSDAQSLLQHLRQLLALLFEGVPGRPALAGPAGATLARCAGAVDFKHLDADMTAACTRVRFWYDRVVARPARRVARRPLQSPDNRTGARER